MTNKLMRIEINTSCLSLLLGLCFLAQAHAQEKSKTVQNKNDRFIELKALEIKAKIHEPALFYVLEQPQMRLMFEEAPPAFTEHLTDPIEGKTKW